MTVAEPVAGTLRTWLEVRQVARFWLPQPSAVRIPDA
jgi:hypothetical protein